MIDEPFVRMIPLSKLVPSLANARRPAAILASKNWPLDVAHGLFQNVAVRPVLDREGKETGKFEVIAGGRRLAALKLLTKRKAILKNYPVPCTLVTVFSGEEVSLAENVFQAPMIPPISMETFARLHVEQGQNARISPPASA